ncbi:hypothetical protein, partial [Gemmatimonas sp.]|uniref:hypothetical protein n=1 Tax=Gemmatimonas sp. TaxID=1962908 RepID=UPI00286E3723
HCLRKVALCDMFQFPPNTTGGPDDDDDEPRSQQEFGKLLAPRRTETETECTQPGQRAIRLIDSDNRPHRLQRLADGLLEGP